MEELVKGAMEAIPEEAMWEVQKEVAEEDEAEEDEAAEVAKKAPPEAVAAEEVAAEEVEAEELAVEDVEKVAGVVAEEVAREAEANKARKYLERMPLVKILWAMW